MSLDPAAPRRRPVLLGLLAATALLLPAAVRAAEADPATPVIESLDASLLEAMKAGKTSSVEARYRRLLPVVERVFDLPTMTRFAVGEKWSSFSAADQDALVKAFGRMTAANLAHNFDTYDGEQIKVAPDVATRGPDKLVRTQIVGAKGETDLNYRMRKSGGSWKVIDVYYGAISQLTAQRSDFAATVASGGAPALLKTIDAKTAALLKS